MQSTNMSTTTTTGTGGGGMGGMGKDGIAFLLREHEEIKGLFAEHDRLLSLDSSYVILLSCHVMSSL
jgi:hypothetical protein